MEHVRNAAARPKVAVMFTKNQADLGRSAVLVVRRRLDDNGDAAGPVAFLNNFIDVLRLHAVTGPAFDRALNVAVRHALRAPTESRCAAGRSQPDHRHRVSRRWRSPSPVC